MYSSTSDFWYLSKISSFKEKVGHPFFTNEKNGLNVMII